jgi:type II secretory pathway component PulM
VTKAVVVLAVVVALVAAATAALAYTCPVLIQQAEETIARVEKGKPSPEARALLAEAKKLLAEARRHHETAKSKKDHDEAIRKAKTAQGLADEALKLQ